MLKKRILSAGFGVLTVGCLIGGISTTVQTNELTLKVSFLGSPEDEDYDGALVFKNYVESRTNGRIKVNVFPSGQFCSNERECIEGLQSGILEVFMTTIGGLGNVFGPAQVLDLPYTFESDRIAECVFDGPIVDQLRDAVLEEGLGIRLMTVSNTGGWRNFATTSKQIRTPEDIQGVKIRTTSASVQQELMRQLDGNPTPVAWSELYTALATGVVEGTKNGIQDIVGMKFHEHIKFLSLDEHAYMGALWWFSDRVWGELDTGDRRIVYDGFQHLKTVTRALPMRRQIEAYAEFEEAGGTVYSLSTEEKAAFRDAAGGMRAWFSETYGSEWLDRLDTAVSTCTELTQSEFDAADQ